MQKIFIALCCLLAIICLPFNAESYTEYQDFHRTETAENQEEQPSQQDVQQLIAEILPEVLPLCSAVGWDNLYWWLEDDTGEISVERLPIAIHELCHEYSCISQGIAYNRFKQENSARISYQKRLQAYSYYYGDGQSAKIIFTELVPTSEMDVSSLELSDELRKRYLGGNTSAEIYGIYGLLNEFNAYSWQAAMRRALAGQDHGSFNRQFYLDYYNGFNGLITTWLDYAADHYPTVYQAVWDDPTFKKIYFTAKERFANACAD